MDREKVVKEFEHLLNAAKGNYQDFVDLTVDGGEEILALLKEQEEREKRICKEICGLIKGGYRADTDDDREYICHRIRYVFLES